MLSVGEGQELCLVTFCHLCYCCNTISHQLMGTMPCLQCFIMKRIPRGIIVIKIMPKRIFFPLFATPTDYSAHGFASSGNESLNSERLLMWAGEEMVKAPSVSA